MQIPIDFKQLFEVSPNPYMLLDRELRYVSANAAYLRVTASCLEELLGRPIFEVFPFLVETGEDARFHTALAGGTAASRDRPFQIGQSAREGYYDATYSPFRDSHGDVAGVLVFVHDITERRRAERRLQESETRFRTMADAAPVMLWMAGLDMGTAMAWAEVVAEDVGAFSVAKSARWRKSKPSEGQTGILDRFGVDSSKMTRGQASDAISVEFASRALDIYAQWA